MTATHITAPDGSLWQLVPVEPTREMKLAGMAANDGIVSYLFRAMLDAAPEFPGEFELDYRRRQMKAVADYLTPNWSNDMEWSDEIIIAIEQRTAAPEFGEGDVDGELNRLADALSQSARMYNEGRTTMRSVANGALDVAQRLRQLAVAPVFGGAAEPALTPTFQQVWAKLQPVERAIISAQFMEPSRCNPHPPAADEAMGRDAARYRWLRANNIIRVFPVSSGMISRGGTRILANTKDWLPGDFTYVIDGITKDVDAAMRGAAEKAGEGD